MYRTNVHVLTIVVSKPTVQRRPYIKVIRAPPAPELHEGSERSDRESATLEILEVLVGLTGFHFRDVSIFRR